MFRREVYFFKQRILPQQEFLIEIKKDSGTRGAAFFYVNFARLFQGREGALLLH